MKRGVDLDGVLTPIRLYNVETKLPWWCALWLIFLPADRKIVKTLKVWQKVGDEIIIISARPKQMESLTRLWLKIMKIPFTDIVLIGPGEETPKRKWKVIREKRIEMFMDDDQRTIEFIRRQSPVIKTILVEKQQR